MGLPPRSPSLGSPGVSIFPETLATVQRSAPSAEKGGRSPGGVRSSLTPDRRIRVCSEDHGRLRRRHRSHALSWRTGRCAGSLRLASLDDCELIRVGCTLAALSAVWNAANENAPAISGRGALGFSGAPSMTRTCDLQVRNVTVALSNGTAFVDSRIWNSTLEKNIRCAY